MLYIIGLGLNSEGISLEGKDILTRCKTIYLESYTVDLPFTLGELDDKMIEKKIIPVDRKFVESLSIIDEAEKKNVALLVYGAPLSATTHITLIEECKKSGVKCKVIYAASVFDAIGETGLQLYKFGKTASMPTWKKSYTPDSFMEIVKQNQSIEAHTLLLVDIGLDFYLALEQLEKAAEKHKFNLGEIVLCQSLGTRNSKIFYDNVKNFKNFDSVRKPYCIIIPGKLHFVEKEVLEGFFISAQA